MTLYVYKSVWIFWIARHKATIERIFMASNFLALIIAQQKLQNDALSFKCTLLKKW